MTTDRHTYRYMHGAFFASLHYSLEKVGTGIIRCTAIRKNRVGLVLTLTLFIALTYTVCVNTQLYAGNRDNPDGAIPASIEYELIRPEQLFIGTPFTLQVSIVAGKDIEIHHPVRDTIGVFAILDIEKTTVKAAELRRRGLQLSDNQTLTTFNYHLAGFDIGEQNIPALRFEIYDEKTATTDIISTPVLRVNIETVLNDSIDNIKDIAPPLKLNLRFWDYFLPLLILAVLTAIILYILKRMKNRPEPEIATIEEDPRPNYIICLELLDKLRAERLLEKGEYIEYHYRLSLILRMFLELEYKFKAVEMTTGEIKQYIDDKYSTELTGYSGKPTFTSYKEILDLLNYSDLVKFAKYQPNINRTLELTEWLKTYLKSYTDSSSSGSFSNTASKQDESQKESEQDV